MKWPRNLKSGVLRVKSPMDKIGNEERMKGAPEWLTAQEVAEEEPGCEAVTSTPVWGRRDVRGGGRQRKQTRSRTPNQPIPPSGTSLPGTAFPAPGAVSVRWSLSGQYRGV